jgi:hypothetical protein
MDPNDPVLMFFWSRIVFDMELPVEEQGVEGRKAFLTSLPSLPPFRVKGEKSSKQKWGSLQRAWGHSKDGYVGPDLFVKTYLALKKKWNKSLSDLLPTAVSIDSPVTLMPPMAENAPSSSSSGSKDSGLPAAAGAKQKAAPKAKAKPRR